MGYPQQYPPQGPPPQIDNNNMTMSIIAIFLFWPLAIPAIIQASKVNPALQIGDYATAQQAAAESKKWSKLALIIGLSLWGLSIIICCAAIALGGLTTSASVNN